ncbi:hypothetical protein HYU96_00640 [Candidatus Daviesbacteria bacterium]|nr:hypothetical protein [Candidatus Daviesbacteria bacterium]
MEPKVAVPPAAPVMMQTPPAPAPTPAKGKTMWLIAGLVIVIVLIAGIYLFQSRQQAGQSSKASPSPAAADSLQQELNSVNLEDLEQEFTGVDQDLQNL